MAFLNPETEKLIQQWMKATGIASADDLVRLALQTMSQVQGESFEDLPWETREAIDEGLTQVDAGELRAWEGVREELRTRFITRPQANRSADMPDSDGQP